MNACQLWAVIWLVTAGVFKFYFNEALSFNYAILICNIWLCGSTIITRLERKK